MTNKIRSALAALALLVAALAPTHAAAQSDILLRLRSGSPLGDRFRVDSASGFVAKGVLGIGIIPFTGAGERLMWHPYKAAFRAGSIGSAGTQWDDANVGFYSWAGGYNTIALGLSSFAMGYQSTALGSYSNALGYTANADGTGAVAIGYRTTADADYSVAIGQRASTNGHAGAIVLSDGSTTDSTQASANNQFTVRSAGGVRLFTNATMTVGVQVAAGGSSWAVISDRNRKGGFLGVDGEDVLLRLRQVPVSTWRYNDEVDRSTLHIGPMAQDWHHAFGFTTDDHTINMSDFDGVNLAAIKALDARTAELQARTAEVALLRTELDATRRRLDELEAVVHRMQEQQH
ncbi:MAG: Hep Hag [Gemmatimonadetes bacterium]|nr:Hep Hag [Gemmatimonadota bacterium]